MNVLEKIYEMFNGADRVVLIALSYHHMDWISEKLGIRDFGLTIQGVPVVPVDSESYVVKNGYHGPTIHML